MRHLIDFFLKRSFLVNLISVFVVLAGLFYLSALKRDLVPAMSFKGVTVSTSFPGASSLQVEKYITEPVENILSGIGQVKSLDSRSTPGKSEVKLRFDDDCSNVSEKADEIKALMSVLREQFPSDVDESRVNEWKQDSAFFQAFALKGIDQENEEHRQYVEKIKEEFLSQKGILKVRHELRPRSFNISLSYQSLEEYELTVDQVLKTVKSKISPYPIASIEKSGEQISVQMPTSVLRLEDLNKIVLRSSEFGPEIYLRDVANLGYLYESDKTIRRLNGENFLSIYTRKSVGSDIIDLSVKTEKLLEKLKSIAPPGVELVSTGSGTKFVQQQLNVLKSNALIGLILVLLILSFFLGPRVALMTAIGIPLSYLGTFIVLYLLGLTINLISLIAMLLIIGILVDDAIVIAERYTKLLQEGLERSVAARQAALSVVGPVSAGIITTMIAFSPIVFVGGWMTEVMISIPVVVISALCISWLEGFFILPEHLKSFVRSAPKERKIMRQAQGLYEKSLKIVLNHRYLFLVFLVALFSSTIYVSTSKIKSDFSLRVRSKKISVFGVFKDEHSGQVILNKLSPLEKYLNTLRDGKNVEQVYLSVGKVWMDGARKNGNRYFQFSVHLDEASKNPDQLEKKYFRMIKEQLPRFKTDDFQRLSVESQLNGDEEEELSSMYTLNFRGKASYSFEELLESTKELGESIDGFVSVGYNLEATGTAWEFQENQKKLDEYNISKDSLALQLRALTDKHDLGYFHSDKGVEKLSVSFEKHDGASDLSSLKNLKVQNRDSLLIPLKNLGDWKEKTVQKVWVRKNNKRNVSFNLKFDDNLVRAEDFQRDLESKLPLLKSRFPDYEIGAEIADKRIKESKEWVFRTIAMCVIGIFFVLALQLQSLSQPLLVCSSILFGFIGSVWAVYLHGYKLQLMAMIGLLGVAGIAVNDSVIMVDYINQLARERGLNLGSIVDGAKNRLRAIVLTTLTTLGGLFPMAYAVGGDSGFTRPMALSMAWGLTASTFLTLFAIPVFVAVANDLGNVCRNIFNRIQSKEKKKNLNKKLAYDY